MNTDLNSPICSLLIIFPGGLRNVARSNLLSGNDVWECNGEGAALSSAPRQKQLFHMLNRLSTQLLDDDERWLTSITAPFLSA